MATIAVKHSKKEQHKAHALLVAVALLMVGAIAFEVSPVGGNVAFYSTWMRCGQKPVATADLGQTNVSYYFEPSAWPGTHSTIDYFCTPLEAEIAGYSASPNRYEFPYINTKQN